MIVGFFHDHNFIVSSGKVYTTGTLDSNYWNRYLTHDIDELIVCARRIDRECNNVLPLSSRDKVTFNFSPNLSRISSLIFDKHNDVVIEVVKKVDVVICRLPSEIGFMAVKEAKKLGKKVICEVVACPYDALSYHGNLLAKLYAHAIKFRMKKWVNNCDGALYVTKEELQNRYPCNGFISNASNVEIQTIRSESVEYRKERFIQRRDSGTLKFGIIGTVKNKTKGVDIAINAIEPAYGSLHVIGSGEPSNYIELAKRRKLRFRHDGFISDKKKVLDWLSDIDVYLQPSFQEGLPRATIEAMSVGCPVLSSDAGGLRELVRSEYVHERGDVVKFKNDIDTIIKNYDLELDTKRSLTIASNYLTSILGRRRYDFYGKFISK